MMKDAILNFPSQFEFEPVIENKSNFKRADNIIVIGMGGSHLAADLLHVWNPSLNLWVHMNYGLPAAPEKYLKNSLIILSSYSGNTEEVIDAFHKAKEKNLPMVAIAVGGKLLDLAKENNVPYVQMPDTGIQPRMALGFSARALLEIIGDKKAFSQTSALRKSLKPDGLEDWGRNLAEKLRGFVPIIYSSKENYPIACNWKVKFNETAKIPSFANRLPEANHNEMAGFDAAEATRGLSENFHFIFLRDANDDPRISRRMSVMENLFRKKGFNAEVLSLDNESGNVFHKIFSSLMLADWTTYHLAEQYGVEPEQVPMVEEFKRLISE